MTFALIALAVSGLAIMLMLYIKSHEIKLGGYRFFPRLREKGDHVARLTIRAMIRFIHVITSRKFWISLIKFLGREFKTRVIMHPHVVRGAKRVNNVIKGRKTIKSTGPVSFYLQDVSEYKNGLQTE